VLNGKAAVISTSSRATTKKSFSAMYGLMSRISEHTTRAQNTVLGMQALLAIDQKWTKPNRWNGVR
jgi:hypothetical protein